MAYRSQFGDTMFRKVFVGGLAWETPTEEMRRYFEQFGEILEAVIINDKVTGKSKGYGFVTFRDPESARKACENPNPMIDGRRANCNIASLGRTKPSPTRSGRPQTGTLPTTTPPSTPPLAQPAIFYPHYGYSYYSPDYEFHQDVYNPQFQEQYYHHQQQLYGASSSTSMMGSPYFYGYMQTPRPHHQHGGVPPYYYYPTGTPAEGSFSMLPSQQYQDPILPLHHSSTIDSQTQQQASTMADQKGVATSESFET